MTRSLILSRQALISGQIRDGRTGEAPGTAVAIGLLDRDVPERRHGLVATVTRDARFAFHGDPETALRGIATQTFWLRLEATATGYRTATLNLEIGPAPGQPTRVEIPGLEREDVLEPAPVAALFTGGGLPREGLRLVLDPEPVRLSGWVLSAAAPDQPIGGALVEIVGGGAVTSDARGRFAFPDPLPLVATVDLRVTAAGFQEHLFDHELAYGEPVNRISVLLRPSCPIRRAAALTPIRPPARAQRRQTREIDPCRPTRLPGSTSRSCRRRRPSRGSAPARRASSD